MRKRIPRRILTAALSLAMLLTLLPATALADGDTGETTTSGIELSKTATLEDDGTYTIDLEAYATGTTTTTTTTSSVPLDIVLVIDQSGSMTDSITTSTSYTARDSQGYTYSNLSSSWGQSAPTYYYLAENGNYYQVKQGSQSTDTGSNRTTYYYLYYTDANGNTVYLSGTGTTTTQPTNVTSNSTTIWTGVLYTATTTTSTKLAALKSAVTSFVETIQKDAETNGVDHRIAIAGFASDNNDGSSGNSGSYTISSGSSTSSWINTGLFINGSLKNYGSSNNNTNTQLTSSDYQSALVSVNNNGSVASSITTAINNFAASGATRTQYGIEMANQVFANNSNTYTDDDGNTVTRKRIVVVFTDGQPGQSGYDGTEANSAISKAYTTKTTYGATIYSVGLYTETQSDNVTNFMNYISSNYPSAQSTTNTGDKAETKYYMTASDADELNNVFSTISSDATSDSTTVTLGADAVLKDIMGNGFTLPNDFTVADNVTIKTVAGTSDGTTITWGDETSNSAKASVSGNTVSVTGFDYADKYISSGHAGEKICVTIKGVLPTTDVTTGEAVNTNAASSGIYATADATEATATFEQPQTIITKKLYVLDYAKTAILSDLDQNSVIGIVDTYKKVSSTDNALTQAYGTSALSGSTLTYTPTTTSWDGYDSLYVFGQTNNSEITALDANKDGNLWSKVSVIPANNVYYEDDFITTQETDEDGNVTTAGTVGIVYTGEWQTVGESASNTETANNDTYGWVESLSDDATYSDGSAHAIGTAGATATFTFTGTGVDIYSRTDMVSGTVIVQVKSTTTKKSVTYVCNDLSTSGTYYQIPTVCFNALDYTKTNGMGYDTYTVTITVTTNGTTDGDGTEQYTYYLDGIRVYNPLGTTVTGDAAEAYAEDNELNAVFTEVRDILIDAESFTSGYTGAGGVVFIDDNLNATTDADTAHTTTDVLGSYEDYGPENEVYLAAGQSIAFQVSGGDHYYLGIKAPNGSTTATVTNGTGTSDLTINHSTDLYYEITPTSNGYIMVKNSGTSLLSITKLRSTSSTSAESGIALLSAEEVDEILVYAASFDSLETVAYTGADEDSAVDTDTGDTYEDLEEDDVVIDNPTEDTEEETEAPNSLQSIFSSLFSTIRSWFSGRR